MTAEEMILRNIPNNYRDLNKTVFTGKQMKEQMIEFAKLKGTEILKAVDLNAEVEIIDYDELSNDPIYGVNSKSILNSYDLNDIK